MIASGSPIAAQRTSIRGIAANARRDERGWVLIEVVWSVVVLGVVIGSVLMSLNSSTVASGLSRARSVAATLAEQDQERLRSYRVIDLSNFYETRTVTLSGRTYTVTSLTEWVRDSNGEPLSCTNASTSADYIVMTSSVTSASLTSHTVRMSSLLAPPVGSFGPSQGTLGVQVYDRAATPVPMVPITISGPDSAVLPTNELGCAIFGYVPAGSYGVTINRAGWVDPAGNTLVSRSGTVTGGNVNTVTTQYDRAASVAVTFETTAPGDSAPRSSSARSVTAANSGVPPEGARYFTAAARQSTLTAANLFPFASGYSLYAGSCQAANPQNYVPDYFEANAGLVQTDPAGGYAVRLRLPPVNVRVTRFGVPYASSRVVLTPTDTSECPERIVATANAAGALVDPGMPFGSYSICADDGSRRVTVSGVGNTTLEGTPPVELPITSLSVLGTCATS